MKFSSWLKESVKLIKEAEEDIDISKLDKDYDSDEFLMFFKEFNEKSPVKIVAVKGALDTSMDPFNGDVELSNGQFIKMRVINILGINYVILALVDKSRAIRIARFDVEKESFVQNLIDLVEYKKFRSSKQTDIRSKDKIS